MTDQKYNLEEILIQDIASFTKDPFLFVMYAFPWGHNELKNFKGPEKWQREVLIDIGDKLQKQKVNEDSFKTILEAIASGHGPGKSALVAWLILWAISTRENTKGVVTANTETQLKTKTWSELAKWYRMCITKRWFTMTATALYSVDKECERTWRFDMIPWSENKTEAFAGMHNKDGRVVVIFDEASAIPDLIWEVTEGALTDKNTEILWLVCGNPTRNVGRFHACFNRLRHRWEHQQVDSREVSLTNKQQIDTWIKDYGENSDFVRVRVKGQFPRASTNQFIPTDVVTAARGRFLRKDQYDFAPVIIGVDRAWSGESETKIYFRQGLMSKLLATFRKDEDDGYVAGHLARLEDEHQADAVFIDFGYGTGLYSFGKQMGRKWTLVPFGGSATNPKYANKRINMWGDMLDWLKAGGSIPDIEDLYTDLIGPEAFSVQTGPNAGKLLLESKKDMQKRGLDSPDDGDALCFVKNTMIRMEYGQKPIQNVKVGEYVYTPFGLRKVLKTWESLTDKLTMAYFSNKKTLTGKPMHEIFTWSNGWRALDSLSLTDTIESDSMLRRILWKLKNLFYIREKNFGFKVQVDIIQRLKIVKEMERKDFFIDGYIPTILVLFHRVCAYIIKIMTGLMTGLKIMSLEQLGNIHPIMSVNAGVMKNIDYYKYLTSIKHELKQVNGMEAKPDENGTLRMENKYGLEEKRKKGISVNIAEKQLSPISLQEQNFVQRIVCEILHIVNIRQQAASVFSAVKNLFLTSIGLNDIVLDSVQTETVSPTKTYNLTIDQDNVYYANGILVANCLTFAFPVLNKSQKQFHDLKQRSQTYDPLKLGAAQQQQETKYNPLSPLSKV